MTALRSPTHGRWAWDSRGNGRAVRVSTHAEAGLLNLSLWRDDICVGTARLAPSEVAGLVCGLTDGLAALATSPGVAVSGDDRLHELELRLARLEHLSRPPVWSRAVPAVRSWLVRTAIRSARRPRPTDGPTVSLVLAPTA